MKTILSALLLLLAAPAIAQDVKFASDVFVERTVTDADGRTTTKLEPPRTVVPGDRVLIELRYSNSGAAPVKDLNVVNPIPAGLAFTGTASPGHELSVDGGKTWGALAALAVPQADGTRRPAQPADVTHVRWTLATPVAPKAAGKLTIGGIVR